MEIQRDTPMYWILQTKGNIQQTILKNSTKIFWLGYFLRKMMQEENLQRVKALNNEQLESHQAERAID